MSSENIYNITGGAPEYKPYNFIITDSSERQYVSKTDGTYEQPNEDFDYYINKVKKYVGDDAHIGAFMGAGEEPALVFGSGILADHFVSKSASTVEQDIREMFGYKHAIKPPIKRRVPRLKKRQTKKQKKKQQKKRQYKKSKKGGDDSSDYDSSDSSHTDPALNDYENASILDHIYNNQYMGSDDAPSCVFCTLVMNGDNYIPGAIVLARSIHEHSDYEVYCMYTDDVSSNGVEILNKHFDKCILVPYIEHDSTPMLSEKQRAIYGGWINKSYTKWNIFNTKLFSNDKIIFVDADMILLENIDDLFDLDCDIAATFSSPWVKPYSTRGFNPYYHMRELAHGDTITHSDIKLGLYEYGIVGLASLVLILRNEGLFEKMLDILNSKDIYGYNCVSGHDEQLLADTIIKNNLICKHIHQQYNWNAGKTAWLGDTKAKTVHYYNKDKPWQRPAKYDDEKYWNKYADAIIVEHPELASILKS